MTRFTFVCDDENCRFKDNGETIDCVEVVDLLNKLYEENKQLRRQNKALKENSLVDAYFKYIGVKE